MNQFSGRHRPAARPAAADDWWADAVGRPLGAYYRIDPENIRDIHIALSEAGAVYASAFTHKGWDAQLQQMTLPAPTSADEVPTIKHATGSQEQGHAFAIVGYTPEGFIIQNSWGGEWGRGGFAVLTYEDWIENAMDCWVAQLGVVDAPPVLRLAMLLVTSALRLFSISIPATLKVTMFSATVMSRLWPT